VRRKKQQMELTTKTNSLLNLVTKVPDVCEQILLMLSQAMAWDCLACLCLHSPLSVVVETSSSPISFRVMKLEWYVFQAFSTWMLLFMFFQMYVGSFSPADYDAFQTDVASAIADFKAAGVTKLLIDLTNNGGM